MNNASLKLGVSCALVAYAYWGGLGVAHAQSPYTGIMTGMYDHFVKPGGEYWTRDNADKATGPLEIDYNPNNGDFTVKTNLNPGNNGFPWYPDTMKGEAWGDGNTTSSNLPIQVNGQVSSIQSMPVTWNISGSTTAQGTWNASFEAWFFTTNPGNTPPNRQEDGTELMVWLSASPGNVPGGLASLGTVAIGGVVWDVRASWWGAVNGGGTTWNYMGYFPVGGGDALHKISMDLKPFLDDAMTRTGSGRNGPCHNGTSGNGNCLYPGWFMSSMQAGFELFNGTHDGEGLTLTGFSAKVNAPVSETNYGQLAVGRGVGNKLSMFNASATDLTVHYSTQTAAGGTTWTSNALADNAMKRVTACTTSDGRLDLWGITKDSSNQIFHKRQSTNGTWANWEATSGWGSEVACYKNWEELMEIVYVGTDNRLYGRREWKPDTDRNGVYIGQSWTGDARLYTDNNLLAKHIAVSFTYPEDGLQLVFTDLSNNLYHIWQQDLRDLNPPTTYGWAAPASIPGQSAVQLSLGWNFDGTVTLVYVGTDSKLYYTSTTSSQINAPFTGGTQLPGVASVTAKQVVFQSAGNGANDMEMFYVGTDSNVYHRSQVSSAANSSWTSEVKMNTGTSPFASQIAAYPGQLFYTTPTGAIYSISKSTGTWGSPTNFNATAAFP